MFPISSRRHLLRCFSTSSSTHHDPFVVLHLPKTATPDQIKSQYYELAKQNHPDTL